MSWMLLPIAHRVDKRLACLRPQRLVVKWARVPHDFIHELRKADRVAGRAGAGRLKGAAARVGDVALVIGTVDIFAVPTSTSLSAATLIFYEGRPLTSGR